jgi:hypothetical protein
VAHSYHYFRTAVACCFGCRSCVLRASCGSFSPLHSYCRRGGPLVLFLALSHVISAVVVYSMAFRFRVGPPRSCSIITTLLLGSAGLSSVMSLVQDPGGIGGPSVRLTFGSSCGCQTCVLRAAFCSFFALRLYCRCGAPLVLCLVCSLVFVS